MTLKQVLGSNVSAIYGHINANGQVFLVNPNGIYFAPGAQVNVGGLVASTEAISSQDLANGKVTFSGNSPNSVVNKGTITTAKGGYVAFIGAVVETGGGIWLLDPYNVTIASNNASGTAFSSNYKPGSNSVILNSSIDTALNAGNNVSITTALTFRNYQPSSRS